MILGVVHRSPGTCLRAEETPRKLQLGDRLMKGLCHCLKWGPFPPNEVVGSHSPSEREKEGIEERSEICHENSNHVLM